MRMLSLLLPVVFVAGLSEAQTSRRPSGNPEAEKAAGSVMIKDWKPRSNLIVPKTDIPKARFSAIDVHAHRYAETPEEVKEWVGVMDEVGIEMTVILTGAVGDRFDQMVELYLKPYPKRFQLYAGVLREGIDTPDYPQKAASELERCYAMGARGLGELSDKGLGYTRDRSLPRDKRLHPDDPRLDLFWKKALELKLSANIHMADHPSAWQPPDNTQERSPYFQRYNQYGRDVPSHQEILEIRDRLLTRHPENTFIACHLSNQGHDLASLTKAMDRFPNLYLDISARAYEMGRQPRAATQFLTKYKDRIMFGTDQGREKEIYLAWWRFLESPDEYIPGPNWWMLYGLELVDSMLSALYRDNAKRILNWE